MRHEKVEAVLRTAMAMQGSAEGFSLQDIQNDLGVSRRTAERVRDVIERVFPQMELASEDELPKRWRIPSASLNGLIGFAPEELGALQTAAALLDRENAADQAERVRCVAAKFRTLLRPETLRRIDPDLEVLTEAEGLAMRPGPRPRIDPAIVGQLRHAILSSRKCRIHYRYRGSGKRGFDTVRPYGFLYGNRHYLVAWSENAQARAFRNFALSNIEKVEVLQSSFQRRKDFSLKAYSERSFGVFQEQPMNVVLHFSKDAATDAREYLFHPTQVVEEQKDGTLVVKLRSGGTREICWHLFTWGDQVKVRRPQKLRNMLNSMVRRLMGARSDLM